MIKLFKIFIILEGIFMLHSNLGTNEHGHLTFAGQDTIKLANEYKTPLYLIDEETIRKNCKTYVNALKKYFGENSIPLFASKALSFKELYRIVKDENMGIDVVSGGELYTAKSVGFPMEKVYFHGNNKTYDEIKFAIDSKIGYFVADNISELDNINKIAKENGIEQKILLRLTPGIDTHTYEAVRTGQVDSKFGTAIETGQALEITKYALSLSNVSLKGFHCHIGSQVFDSKTFCDSANIMLDFIKEVYEKFGFMASILNLGGGYGVRYTEDDPHINIEENIKIVSEYIKNKCTSINITMPTILMEPGRSIVADAGLTLYTVGNIKTITGYKSYVSIDGGMTDNPRFALYESKYSACIANRANEDKNFLCTIAGKCCESGDLIAKDIKIQNPQLNDTLAVFVTGAYNYSMSSNYNRIPKPMVVVLNNGTSKIAVMRESYEDLIRNDI